MPAEVSEQIGQAIGAVIATLVALGLNELRKLLKAKTTTTLDERAVDVAEDVLADLVLQLSPAVGYALADGKIDDLERRRLMTNVEAILGKAGLEKLRKATGLDASGVIAWVMNKLGAKAHEAKAEGLGPFFASEEYSKSVAGK